MIRLHIEQCRKDFYSVTSISLGDSTASVAASPLMPSMNDYRNSLQCMYNSGFSVWIQYFDPNFESL
jgi:hypothetical protein